MYDASDRKDVRRAEKAAKIADQQRKEIVFSVMSTTAGRRYYFDLIAAAHVFSTSFSSDPLQLAFNEGERNQGLKLLNDITAFCPDEFIQMLREANDRYTAAERSSVKDRDGGDSGPSSEDGTDDGGEDRTGS